MEIKTECNKTGLTLNAKHIVSCCRKVSAYISALHDTVVKILLNNILVQRGLIAHEQRWEDRKHVRTSIDEITVGTEHLRSDEWKGRGRVAGTSIEARPFVAPTELGRPVEECGCQCLYHINRQDKQCLRREGRQISGVGNQGI